MDDASSKQTFEEWCQLNNGHVFILTPIMAINFKQFYESYILRCTISGVEPPEAELILQCYLYKSYIH